MSYDVTATSYLITPNGCWEHSQAREGALCISTLPHKTDSYVSLDILNIIFCLTFSKCHYDMWTIHPTDSKDSNWGSVLQRMHSVSPRDRSTTRAEFHNFSKHSIIRGDSALGILFKDAEQSESVPHFFLIAIVYSDYDTAGFWTTFLLSHGVQQVTVIRPNRQITIFFICSLQTGWSKLCSQYPPMSTDWYSFLDVFLVQNWKIMQWM